MNKESKKALYGLIAAFITGSVVYAFLNDTYPWCDKDCQRMNRIREYQNRKYMLIEECVMRNGDGENRLFCKMNVDAQLNCERTSSDPSDCNYL